MAEANGITLNRVIERALNFIAVAMASLAAVGMVGIVGIIVTSVFLRKFANSPVHITEEVVGLLLSVSLFLGLPLVTLRAKHVRVSLLSNALQGSRHRILQSAALLVGCGFFAWLATEAFPWWEFAFRLNLKTETSRILLHPWMLVVPIALTLTGLIYAARLFGMIDRIDDASELDNREQQH